MWRHTHAPVHTHTQTCSTRVFQRHNPRILHSCAHSRTETHARAGAHTATCCGQTSASAGGSVTPPRGHMVSEETIPETLWPQSPVQGPLETEDSLSGWCWQRLATECTAPRSASQFPHGSLSPRQSVSEGAPWSAAHLGLGQPQGPWEGGQGSLRTSWLPDAEFASSDLDLMFSPPLPSSAGGRREATLPSSVGPVDETRSRLLPPSSGTCRRVPSSAYPLCTPSRRAADL